MIKTLLGSASQLHRTLECPASVHLPIEKPQDYTSEAAQRGINIHSFLESAPIDYLKALDAAQNNRAYCQKIDILQTAGYYTSASYREVAFAINGVTGEVRNLGRSINRSYEDLVEEDIPGTVDVLIPGFKSLEVWDYKTGRNPPEIQDNPQLLFAGYCGWKLVSPEAEYFILGIQHLLSGGRIANSDVQVKQWDLDRFMDLLRFATEKARVVKGSIESGGDPLVKKGSWCEYCPAKRVCPAWT
jgi:hypothetical protein